MAEARAFHTSYSYRVDRFEADGNLLGDFDGTPDVVDEFDAPPLAPLWYQSAGTVTEADGYMVLQSPGLHFAAPDGGQSLDMSVAGGFSQLVDGLGDFSGTAYWEGVVPSVDQHYYLSVFTFSGPLAENAEIFGIAIRRTPTAVEVEQAYTELNRTTFTYRNTQLQFHAIDPGDVTGRIGFRVGFDDETNRATTAFSLDGGGTWQSPFPGRPIFQGRTSAQFILGADPRAAPDLPSTTSTTTITSSTITPLTTSTTVPGPRCSAGGCRRGTLPFRGRLGVTRNRHSPGSVRVHWAWSDGEATALDDFVSPFGSGGTYEFCLGDASGRVLTTASTSTSSCCWKARNREYDYRNKRARGFISEMELHAGFAGDASVTVRAPGIPAPALPLALPVTARLRASNGECWAETFWPVGTITNGPKQFIGKPGSSSGAFVD